jgi:hypothetical protein
VAQAARRSAWPSSQVEQAEKQARVWADGLVELHERTGGRFGRVEPRRRAVAYLQAGRPRVLLWLRELQAIQQLLATQRCWSTGRPSLWLG